MNLKGKKVTLHDMSLRDGMHPKRHQITLDQMVAIATGLDAAGVPLIEVTHGDGLGGESVNYGFPAHGDDEYLAAVIPQVTRAKVSALLIPGMGTVDHLKIAHDIGVHTIRVATHCTEAFTTEDGNIWFERMEHSWVRGKCRYCGASQKTLDRGEGLETHAYAFVHTDDVKARIGALRDALKPETEIGFHGHHNLAMGVANSIAAIEAGATRIDGSAAGLGAGAGNTPLEVFAAVCDRMGIETGVDLYKLMDVAEDLVVPMMDHPIRVDRDALTLGYAGVYSSFLLFAKRAEAKYGVSSRDILVELGRRGTVGGQEDMIEDVALDMSRQRVAGGAVERARNVSA